MDFAGVAGGERVLPSPLGWYFFNVFLYLRTQLNSSIHLLLVDFMNTHLSIIHVTKSYTLHSIHDILEIFPIIFVLFKLTHSVQWHISTFKSYNEECTLSARLSQMLEWARRQKKVITGFGQNKILILWSILQHFFIRNIRFLTPIKLHKWNMHSSTEVKKQRGQDA